MAPRFRSPLVFVCITLFAFGLRRDGWGQGDEHSGHVCPIDGSPARAMGSDGNVSPKMYTDLELPSQAYTNLVVACAKCGYAAWAGDFSRQVDAATEAFVRQNLSATARRAGEDPLFAFKHHIALLQHRNAPLRERIGALVFESYVMKRRRPRGGSDPAVEKEILAVRKDMTALLAQALREDPPKSVRARLEWLYLLGELTRLTGDPARAKPVLAEVCKDKENLGVTIGRMACEQADKAARGDTFEEYRDGIFNPVAAVAPKPADPTGVPPDPSPAAQR